MEKQKRWQFYLILAVLLVTLYNVLPTVFYYSKPLKSPINEKRTDSVVSSIVNRVNALESESISWLAAYSRLLGIKPKEIALNRDDPKLIDVTFKNSKEANLFARFLPMAGSRINFVPAQLELYSEPYNDKVTVSRKINVHLDPQDRENLFNFSMKFDENGELTPLYRDIVYDRAYQLIQGFGGASKEAVELAAVLENDSSSNYDDLILSIAKEIVDANVAFGIKNPITKRFYASFSQNNGSSAKELPQKFLKRVSALKLKLVEQVEKLGKESSHDPEAEREQNLLKNQVQYLEGASELLKQNLSLFKMGKIPFNEASIQKVLADSYQGMDPLEKIQTINLDGRNPFVESILIDWSNDKIVAKFYPEVQQIRTLEPKNEESAYQKDKLSQLVVNAIARASRLSDETILPDDDLFSVKLTSLTDSQSLLTLDLAALADKQVGQISDQIDRLWIPHHEDLIRDAYPIRNYEQYKRESLQEQNLGIVVYAPSMYQQAPPSGFRKGSIYVIAKGLETIRQKYQDTKNSENAKLFMDEFSQLGSLLQKNGFIGYQGSLFGIDPAFKKDIIFELDDYYSNFISATRENISVKGGKRFGVLDFSDVEQRILTQNKIEDAIQEDLVKWKDEYQAAQVDLDITNRYLVPSPTKNIYWQNFLLTMRKYFRGDERKILKWGLDLSGGKTVRIGLRDQNNRPVTNPDDLKQAVNELYTRINNLGVSERSIRIENNNIILDFPGSQGLSAQDLIKASAMYFHIVNEKFSSRNSSFASYVQQFLQDVWNEAVVTNRKDIESINEIAWSHLGGEVVGEIQTRPRSEAANVLYKNGLRLANPKNTFSTSKFDDSLSKIALFQESDSKEWDNSNNPLIIVFNNFALEGSSLANVNVGYDPSKGNTLNFGVKRFYEANDKKGESPRSTFYDWTSQFAESRIQGTPKESYTRGQGWRMAVILNNRIVSSPRLSDALKDGGSISGRFSQREINQLAADLKAGSLSFTPRILSEHNVSPELGKEERSKGITASVIALMLVVVAMVGYYRFAGFVASIAVFLNLFIMWGVLQNLDAALTLPGIAAIVLTIGMAVDANVLVFERIREEFKISGRIASAIQAGYKKAFSAIIDSNTTTIIAALILIQFDSGPIKGFAVMLIIGILSSMFTALFMTRYFFTNWAQNLKNKALVMSEWISNTNFNFIKQTRFAFLISLVVLIIGGYFFIAQRNTIFGMDFTGGYALTVEVEPQADKPSYRLLAYSALVDSGAPSTDVVVRELSKPDQLKIQLGIGMEELGRPFHNMPESENPGKQGYEYQKNPRISWVVNALQDHGLSIQKSQLENLDNQWTAMGSQFSDTMRNNAIMALTLALLSILIYITFRFEFKYAIAAVIALAHDIFITLGIFAIFHKLGFAVQIDLQVIGAVMTIIGYSLNDTIIVFDRIREDMRLMRKQSFTNIINHALNVTLGRTLMTSGTTLLVLFALVILGGHSIFAFALVMTIGVLVGTLSSLFIAPPVMLYFHNREHELKKNYSNPRRV